LLAIRDKNASSVAVDLQRAQKKLAIRPHAGRGVSILSMVWRKENPPRGRVGWGQLEKDESALCQLKHGPGQSIQSTRISRS
jgi:hypothetical protein